MTGHASMETAIEAVRLGAFDYITKPCKLSEIETVLHKVIEKRDLKHKNLAFKNLALHRRSLGCLDPALQRQIFVFRKARSETQKSGVAEPGQGSRGTYGAGGRFASHG